MKKSLNTTLCTAISVSLLTAFNMYAIEELTKTEAKATVVDTPEQTVTLLKDLISKNEAFSLEIAHPELAIKATIWQRKGVLKLPPTIPWETFKKDVHQFGVALYALLEKDAKGTYYHIEELRNNTLLYHALVKLNRSIPKKENAGNGEPISKIGKLPSRLLVHRINVYAIMFYAQKLLELLNTFFKKFEERAQRLRMKEEQAQKAAERRTPSGWLDSFDFEYTRPDLETTIDGYDTGTRPEIDEAEFDTAPQETEIDWGF